MTQPVSKDISKVKGMQINIQDSGLDQFMLRGFHHQMITKIIAKKIWPIRYQQTTFVNLYLNQLYTFEKCPWKSLLP